MTGRGSWPEPRAFTGKQRVDLYLKADGNCQICGVELKARWHADHVVPWSAGGETSNENGQALCPQCNMTKGSTMPLGESSGAEFKLRDWQQRAIKAAMKKFVEPGNFLCSATPGAGKTALGAKLARAMFDSGAITQIMIISPSINIKLGWTEALHKEGIPVDPTWSGADTVWKSDTNRMLYGDAPEYFGPSLTYNALASAKRVLNWHCQKHSTLVIIDEVHHAAESRTWGGDLSEAFGLATYRLLLSGTPVRHDNNRIQFLNYELEDGLYVMRPDFVYTYAEALEDGIVRPTYFIATDSDLEWDFKGEVYKSTLSEDWEEVQNHRLTAALAPFGDFVKKTLLRSDDQLSNLRIDGHSNAQGLIVCMNQEHSELICKALKSYTPATYMLVHSDMPNPHTIIETFKKSDCRWLVSVAMVSEGVNIPNLRILNWFSNITTETAHFQGYGRVARWIEGLGRRQDAYVYLPHDARFLRHAEKIALPREDVIRQKVETDAERLRRFGELPNLSRSRFEAPILIEAINTRMSKVVHAGISIDGADVELVQAAAKDKGVLVSDSMAHDVVRVSKLLGVSFGVDNLPRVATPKKPVELPLHLQKLQARQELDSLVNQLTVKENPPNGKHDIWKAMMAAFFGESVKEATLNGLELRIVWSRNRLRRPAYDY